MLVKQCRRAAKTAINNDSRSSIDKAPYCEFCLEQEHRATACKMILDELQQKLMNAGNENLKTLQI